MTEPSADDGEPTVTFNGPTSITGDVVGGGKIVQNYGVIDAERVRELTAKLAEYQAVLAERGEGWSPDPRKLPMTFPPERQVLCAGRDHETNDLERALRNRRDVEVNGSAGIGKTALLMHAAAVGVLSAETIPDCPGVLWPRSTAVGLADTIQEIVLKCYEIPASVPVDNAMARRLLQDVCALVVLDDLDLSTEDVQVLRGLMPRSVFVVSSRVRGLPDSVWSLPVGRLPWDVSLALLEGELGEPLKDHDLQQAEHLWESCDGNPGRLIELAKYMREAAARGTTSGPPTEDELPLVVPRLVGWLAAGARSTLDTLATLGVTAWGTELLAVVTGVPEQRGAAKLVQSGLAIQHDGRYHLPEHVIDSAAGLDLAGLAERITTWVAKATPSAVAEEAQVIVRTLRLGLDRGHHGAALVLARAASRKLILSSRWGAWGSVAALGLRAATLTGSVRDEAYFRYALAAGKLPEGQARQVIEWLIAAVNQDPPPARGSDGPEVKLSANAQDVGSMVVPAAAPLTPIARLVATIQKAGQQAQNAAVIHAPAIMKLVQAAKDNPVVRVIGLVTTLVAVGAAVFTQSNATSTAAAEKPAEKPATVMATTTPTYESVQPGAPATDQPGPPIGSTPTGTAGQSGQPGHIGQVGVGTRTTAATGPGSGIGGTGGSDVNPPPWVAGTWGFAMVRYADDPIGTTRPLTSTPQHPGNNESNWTYGAWQMSGTSRKATVTHQATGRHLVTLPTIGRPGGTAHVTTFDFAADGSACQPVRWYQHDTDELVEVACFDKTGAVADVPFSVLFRAGDGHNGDTVTRTGVGQYRIAANHVVQVSPVGTAQRFCSITSPTAVSCVARGGQPADTEIVVTSTGNSSLLDDSRVPHAGYVTSANGVLTSSWSSKPGATDVTRTAIGRYAVHLPVGYIHSYTHVTASGGGYCSLVLRNDYSYKDNATFHVACFSANGSPYDTGFHLTYMTASPYE